MDWIDTHVHIFSRRSEEASKGPLLKSRNELNDAKNYLDELQFNRPKGVVVVDFSKSENSVHVIESLKDLKEESVPVAGIIKADMAYPKTLQWLNIAEVKGVRVYAKEGVPSLVGPEWNQLFEVLQQHNKHILVFGGYKHIAGTVAQIPADITVVIDHLGLPNCDDPVGYQALLNTLSQRKNVYMKGPGYRTSLAADVVVPLVAVAKEVLGPQALMLGASDGPFAGPIVDPHSPDKGQPLADFINYQTVCEYTQALARAVSESEEEAVALLYGNAKRLYEF